jgi:hypothetical protein
MRAWRAAIWRRLCGLANRARHHDRQALGAAMMQLDLLPPQQLPARSMVGACRAADKAIKQGADKAKRIDPLFIERASAHILSYLAEFGVSSGELLTDACKLAGIRSSDDRHFGAVYRRMLSRGLIRWAGDCKRSKGNACRGGSVYAVVR